ncbi:MAG TPA: hypothetical protein VGU21_00365 [Streptosporangiaceae bacterium]|nr:hypothetical protein [Streptosporangiaceae bacterium]
MVAVPLAWDRALELAWDRTLELAWESFCGATTPVGAVVTDAAGAIVTEGRGRRFEATAPPRQLAWTPVAHAELHITWIMRAAGPHVLAAQQEALPDQAALAARPATQRLLTEAAESRIPLAGLRTALRGTL